MVVLALVVHGLAHHQSRRIPTVSSPIAVLGKLLLSDRNEPSPRTIGRTDREELRTRHCPTNIQSTGVAGRRMRRAMVESLNFSPMVGAVAGDCTHLDHTSSWMVPKSLVRGIHPNFHRVIRLLEALSMLLSISLIFRLSRLRIEICSSADPAKPASNTVLTT